MEGRSDTEWLRAAAASWTLAGDQRLLAALQSIHERVVWRCGETRARLAAAGAALHSAALALDNVNNKFVSLSSSQFVERRVYDDDDVIASRGDVTSPPRRADTVADDEVALLALGLQTLEGYHETVTLPPDSDSDSDTDDRAVAAVAVPRALYAGRALPRVLGSRHFRDKWHAGLLPSESESDSSSSLGPPDDDEEYSDDAPPKQESSGGVEVQGHIPRRRASSSSSGSAQWSGSDMSRDTHSRLHPDAATRDIVAATKAATPAEVAAELARRLGVGVPERATREDLPADLPADRRADRADRRADRAGRSPRPAARPLYKPAPPALGVVFPCEPPPLDTRSDSQSEHEDDIFAELDHSAPAGGDAAHSAAGTADGLFGDFSVPACPRPRDSAAAETTPTKKPVGGISVFGAHASESIGAAVVRRRQPQGGDREYSDTDSDDGVTSRNTDANRAAKKETGSRDAKPETKRERDIFDELFAKSEKAQKKSPVKQVKETKVEKKETKKIDLFDDSIFDDIDDIFNSNTVKVTARDDKKKTSIFDDDDDDLFSDIAKVSDTKSKEKEIKTIKNDPKVKKPSIFNSDDDLFGDATKTSQPMFITKAPDHKTSEVKPSETAKQVDSLFNDDDELLFKNTKINNLKDEIIKDHTNFKVFEQKTSVVKSNQAKDLFKDEDRGDSLFSENPKQYAKDKVTKLEVAKPEIKCDKPKLESKVPNIQSKSVVKNIKNEISIPEQIVKETEANKVSMNQDKVAETKLSTESAFSESENELFLGKSVTNKANTSGLEDSVTTKVQKLDGKKVDDLFSDINNDDLFLNVNTDSKEKLSVSPEKEEVPVKTENPQINIDKPVDTTVCSPDIFEDDIDDLFMKSNTETKKSASEIIDNKTPVAQFICNKGTHDVSSSEVSKEPDREDNVKSILDDINKVPISKSDGSDDSVKSLERDKFDDDLLTDIKKKSKQIKVSNDKGDRVFEQSVNVQRTEDTDDFNIYREGNDVNDNNVLNNVLKETKITNINSELNESNVFQNKSKQILDDISIKSEIPNFEDLVTDNINKNIIIAEPPKPDIFVDVFNAEPPAFEKPKEPKKSKNVNALFDDDSDDEALFFKKNDVGLDENPENYSPNTKSNMFGIFHEEPPAIDDDFLEVSKKKDVSKENITTDTSNSPRDIFADNDFDDLFTPKLVEKKEIPESEEKESNSKPKVKSDENIEIMSKPDIKAKPTAIQKSLSEQGSSENSSESADKADGSAKIETKKIGKLKPTNLNINVNTLLPGASPKKVQKEQTDGQAVSAVSNKDVTLSPTNSYDEPIVSPTNSKSSVMDSERKLVKSVSFEGDPESPVLDNKISKDRAKIQVKRRPSTRRARREAVKKSGIDFGEDSTDNSSSMDDNYKSKESRHEVADEKRDKPDLGNGPSSLIFDNSDRIEVKIKEDIGKSGTEDVKHKEIENKISEEILQTEIKKEGLSSSESSPSRDVTSKVVYVLNDEDIFSDSAAKMKKEEVVEDLLVSQEPENKKKPKVLNIVDDDDDDLFNTIPLPKTEKLSQNDEVESITTLGKVYKNENKIAQKKQISILDSDDDDDLFKSAPKFDSKGKEIDIFFDIDPAVAVPKTVDNTKSENTKHTHMFADNKVAKPKDIFTDENMTKGKDTFAEDTGKKPAKAKKSLFDDVSDDDSELFGSNVARRAAAARRNTPAALFASDSDDELFSGPKAVKTASNTTTSKTEKKDEQQESKSETKDVKKVAKKVTSIFGDDDDDDEALFGGKRG